MTVSRIQISNFRNIIDADINLGENLNFFVGQNGSGKSSLIESVYYLGRARSFRTSQTNHLVRYNADFFRLLSRFENEPTHLLGIERDKQKFIIKRDGVRLKSLSELADSLPVILVSHEHQRIFQDGPSVRRSFLDWGLFYTLPGYRELILNYSKSLRNRNSALKNKLSDREITIWDSLLCDLGEKISSHRREYFNRLVDVVFSSYSDLIISDNVISHYRNGWPESKSLHESFADSLERDKRAGSTQSGSHRDDFRFESDRYDISQTFSRGQLKRFHLALVLAQKNLFRSALDRPILTLIDDLASELDLSALESVLKYLHCDGDQYMITLIPNESVESLCSVQGKMFHVEHGQILAC